MLQQRGPGHPRPRSTHSWEMFGALSLRRGPERCSWINVANPGLSCSLCLIDADGFSSAFVGGKNALFVVMFKNPLTAVLSSLCTQPAASYMHAFFFSDCTGRWLLLARLRVVLCHMLLIFLLIFLLCAEPVGDREQRSTAARLQMLPSAARRCHPYISRG